MPVPPFTLPQDKINSLLYMDECGVMLEYGSAEAAVFFTAMAKQIEHSGMNNAYPVGAVYFGVDQEQRGFFIPCVNTIPEKILDVFDGQERVAGSHMTVHAEMEGMILLPAFEQLSVAVSRPICPTCLEGLSVLSHTPTHDGHVDMIYMDGESLGRQSTQEKWDISEKMVTKIAQRGAMGLGFVDVGAGELSDILVEPQEKNVLLENPVSIEVLEGVKAINQVDIGAFLREAKTYAESSSIPGNEEAVILIGRDEDRRFVSVTATASLPPGFSAQQDQALFEHDAKTTKRSYLYQMDALKRALINAHMSGIDLQDSLAVCTVPPSAGMLVNAVGYGVAEIATSHKIEFEPGKVRDHLFLEFIRAGVLERITPRGDKRLSPAHTSTQEDDFFFTPETS